ncbi:MAG: tRNA (guanosine(37)-N1)-methyltransferase TrmD [Proteobacteria bacterium]|nr:tRNA (guanosine(37)-N1)-methyltransferase TrmD [Pseudomonadota bacterium]MBU1745786.1 tRNA (guanosine(37)-N1)-methyltransferase TrmD [Pseudomonadota bacterium]MBU1964230.1 tRNA (guanosine(37)-N1)-methyltransferase TrmD [Pseudomonadota bacterium]MBU4372464.1 tRNA (guanosine(37)-N1)-methyltransferase TrmD [Pseudomonadota bacterium]
MRFDILTVFPEMFASPCGCSLLKKAADRGFIAIHLHDIRSHAEDKHHMTDDAPYGGGGGMVMKVEPIDRALQSVPATGEDVPIVLMTPQGEPFCQKMAEELAGHQQIILICGHYEGVDERVRTHLATREISIGDYVLTGGELSAMVIVDAVSRLVPGVLGNCESASSDSFSMGLLEYPHYTRPAAYRGWEVPDVLLSGNHREIEAWRRRESLLRTRKRRPDLLKERALTIEEKKWLDMFIDP